MRRIITALFCLSALALTAGPALAQARIGGPAKSKSKKKSVRKARTVKRVSRAKTKRTTRTKTTRIKSTVKTVKPRSKSPARLKAPPGRRAPRTRAPGDRRYRDGYWGRRNGYRAGYNDGYSDANYRSRRRADGGNASGRSDARRPKGPPIWSGGLLVGGVTGNTTLDQTEYDTALGVFGELNFRGVVTKNLSLGIHAGGMHNRVESDAIADVTLGSLGADMAFHFSRKRNGPYIRGGVGFAHATVDPGDAFAAEVDGAGWYAKAGVGISLGVMLIEGNCTQYNIDELSAPGLPSGAGEMVRCGVGIGFGR